MIDSNIKEISGYKSTLDSDDLNLVCVLEMFIKFKRIMPDASAETRASLVSAYVSAACSSKLNEIFEELYDHHRV